MMLQVKYGWSPKANLGPQIPRMAERTRAEALRDAAELMDYEAAYGKEAWQSSGAPAVHTNSSAGCSCSDTVWLVVSHGDHNQQHHARASPWDIKDIERPYVSEAHASDRWYPAFQQCCSMYLPPMDVHDHDHDLNGTSACPELVHSPLCPGRASQSRAHSGAAD